MEVILLDRGRGIREYKAKPYDLLEELAEIVKRMDDVNHNRVQCDTPIGVTAIIAKAVMYLLEEAMEI